MASTYLALKQQPAEDAPSFATPMVSLENFLPKNLGFLTKIFAALLVGIGLVNGNLVQANSIAQAVRNVFGVPNLVIAIGITTMVGIVIIGGLQSIVRFCVRITPTMLVGYIGVGLFVLVSNPADTARAFILVMHYAFHPHAIAGGAAGGTLLLSIQYGVSRGIFSHGSGVGMGPFFQSANHDHPGRGALMGAVVPLFDTMFVCTITGLVIISKGFYTFWTSAYLTVSAFETGAGLVGRTIVFACLGIFAFTTIISWAHFGERCFSYLGGKNKLLFRGIFLLVTIMGPFFPVNLVWSLGDILIGLVILVHVIPLAGAVMKNLPSLKQDIDAVLDGTIDESQWGACAKSLEKSD